MQLQSADLARDVMHQEKMSELGLELASWKNSSKREMLEFIEENVRMMLVVTFHDLFLVLIMTCMLQDVARHVLQVANECEKRLTKFQTTENFR